MQQPLAARRQAQPTGVIETLSAGYSAINHHLWVLVLPILLDLRSVFGGTIYGPYRYSDGRRKRVWVLRNWQLQEALPFLDRWLPPSHKREQ